MKISRHHHLVEILFNDSASKNSFSLEKAQRWLQEVISQPTHLMILRSEGSVFCSGGNLKEYAKMTTKEQGLRVNAQIRDVLHQISQVPCPKVAFVSGDCFGGGVEVLSVCDQIYSLNHVFFGLWQSRMHLSLGWGGLERLNLKLDALELQMWLSEGATHSAFWCQQKGLIDEILTETAMQAKLNKLKNTMNSDRAQYLSPELLEDEAAFFESLWWSERHRKALRGFKA